MDIKATAFKVLGWLAASFFVLLGVSLLWMSRSPWVVLTTAGLVFLCIPPAREWTRKQVGSTLDGLGLVVVCGVVFIVQMVVATEAAKKVDERREAEQRKEVATKMAKARADRVAEFEANKSAILSDIEAKRAAGDLAGADALIGKYQSVSKDPDFARMVGAVALAKAKTQLATESSMTLAQRVALYKTLAEGEPGNAQYVTKAKNLAVELEAQQAKEKAEADKVAAAAARKQRIEAQFSKWDGSHNNLERAVQKSMKNPDSYKHVETRYLDTGKKIIVTTTFRGTNSFNAVVPNTVIAEVDEYGNILSMANAK